MSLTWARPDVSEAVVLVTRRLLRRAVAGADRAKSFVVRSQVYSTTSSDFRLRNREQRGGP
jgi:hypothetical protein